MSDRDLFEKAGEYRRRRAMDSPDQSGDAAPRLDVRALDEEPDGLSAFATEAELNRSVPVEASPSPDRSSPPGVSGDTGLAEASFSTEASAPKTPNVLDRAAGLAAYAIRRVERFEREIPSRVRQFRREQVEPLVTRLEDLHPVQTVRTRPASRSSIVYGLLGLMMVAAATLFVVNGLRGWLDADEPAASVATVRDAQAAIPSESLATGDAAETSGGRDVSPSPAATPPATPVQEPDGPQSGVAAPLREAAPDSGASLANAPPRAERVTSGSTPAETGSSASGGAPSESVRPLAEPAAILPAAAAPVTGTQAPAVLAPPPPVTTLPPPVTTSLPAASTTTPPAASASPAASSRPPPTTAEPDVVTSATAPQLAIQSKLRQYADAFSALDAQRAKAVWPAVNERSLARAFAALEEQQVELGRCEISVTGATARASCEGTASYRPKVGNRSMRAEAREWTFRLQQNGADWSIADVQTR